MSNRKKKKLNPVDEYSKAFYSAMETHEKPEIAPVVSNVSTFKGVYPDERTWFNGGAFDDGYQFGDVTKTILGTASDLTTDLTAGLIGIGENVIDAGAYAVGQVGGLLGFDEFQNSTADFIKKDIIDEQKYAKYIGGLGGLEELILKPLGTTAEDTSVLGEKTDALAQSTGQMAGTALLQSAGVPWWVTSGLTSFGSSTEGALNEGATYNEAGLSALITAGAEVLTEKLFGGSGLGEKGFVNLDSLTKGISNKLVKTLVDFGIDVTSEGIEEVFSEIAGNLASSLYREESIKDILFSEEALDSYLESFIGGMVIGGVMNTGKAVDSAKSGRDYRSDLNADEQKVFDKVFNDQIADEQKNGKLTGKRKAEIYDEVMRMMEKGYISTDTIESVLGGDTYKTHQDTVAQEQKLQKEYDDLYQMKTGDKSDQQIDRQAELKKQLEEIKNNFNRSQLGDEVMSKVKGGRLAESYAERSRRGQAYQANLEYYPAKQKETIQRAIDSGILNNTNRTHEFVDMIAKISAQKGITFDFTNNENLKNSGFAIEGKIVNGYLTKDGVTINVDSAKALESVVGHEVAHVLEGSALYYELQRAVVRYASARGEYKSKYAEMSKLYEGVKDADIDKELTADLVGDYLFNNPDFIKHLSTVNRNVFQKIWDEIKYLFKVATAGSKEARRLEKLKKAFEDAYRESGRVDLNKGNVTTQTAMPVKSVVEEDVADEFSVEEEVSFSLSKDTEYMGKAIEANNASMKVDANIMEEAKTLRERIANRMNEIKDRGLVALPDDVEGNTYIANSSYDGTEENTTICPRSLASEAFVDAVSEYLGRPLTVEEQIYISQDLQGRTLTPECLYCYVATDRKAYRAFLGDYVAQRDAVLEKIKANPDIDVSRLASDHNKLKNNPKAEVSPIGELYREFLGGRKVTDPMYNRFKMWVDAYQNGKPMVEASHLANMNKLMGDINEFGEELRPQIVDAMKYAQSASWAKKRVNYVAYNGHILKWKQDRINKLNSHYGLRMYSFSDFHPAFVLENMQMITDASVRGLKMLGYTKDTDFVEIFAPSGMNINVSTFGFESGGEVFENNLTGADWETAKRLREQYPNVGVTFVATNDTLVEWALAQDWIDVVIPYHLVRTGAEVAKALEYTNYTSESSDTKTAEWKKGDKKYIAPTEHNNDKATYLAALEKNHLKPRFERFLDNPNYMKLVNECRQPSSKSKPVQPVFNEDAAMKALAKLEVNGYYQPIGGSVDRMYEIAAEVAENMRTAIAPAMSLSAEGEAPIRRGFGTYGRDIALESKLAPENRYDIAPVVTQTDVADIAPVIGEEHTPGEQTAEEQEARLITRSELHENIMNGFKDEFSAKGYDLDSVLKNAKNLSTFSTVDNTPPRVMEKSLGYKEGKILSDLTVNKVAQNETEGIKWLNSFTDRKSGFLRKISDQYNIKPGSKESAAAQMYAEGFYVGENNEIIAYGDAELAADFPNKQTQANIKGLASDPRIRQIYDETLAAINESRTRNGYPAIPRLDNYFLHFRAMDDAFSRLGVPFNPNDIRAKDLPTDLNGVTADLKPGKPFFASEMHRKGKRTSFDLLGGLERYLTSAKNQIYHIDDIQRLRALRNYIADMFGQANGLSGLDALTEEETQDRIEKVYGSHLSTFAKFLNEEANILAGKTALIDRGLEGIIGRRGIQFLNNLNQQVGSNQVGYSVSSPLTNFLPVVQTFAKTNKTAFVKAFAQTASNALNTRIHGRSDGFAEQSPVMIRRKGADRFHRTFWQKISDPGYALMSAVDNISTELIARTKYNELTAKGMDSQTAHYETDKWVSRLMGDRSLGQMPQLYNSKMLGLITKYQLEVRNQLDSQFYDTIQEAKLSNEDIQNALERNARTAAKVTSTFVQLAVAQHIFGTAFEAVAGYNPAFDIIDVLIKTFGWDDEEDSEDTALDNIEEGFLALMEDLPYTSVITNGGRIPISSALPIEQLFTGKDQYGNEVSRLETVAETLPYYLMPGGYGQLKKTVQGLSMYSDEHPIAGSYTDSGNLRFPVGEDALSVAQAALFGQWSSKNAREYMDNERKPLNDTQTQEFIALGESYDKYWEYRDDMQEIADRAEVDGASDEDILKDMYINSVDSQLSDMTSEKEKILANDDLTEKEKAEMINDIDERFNALVKELYSSYNTVERDGDFAQIGNSYFQWYTNEKGEESYWRKLTDDQVTKYKIVRDAENAHYATDGTVHYRLEEGGDWRNFSDWTKISDSQLARQNEVTAALGITPEEYWSKTQTSFFSMAEGEYEYAYNYPGNYAVAKAVGGYDAYRQYSTYLNNLEADKDENGNNINGSRKQKVLEYINGLDVDYYTKIILWKSQYTSDNTYNEEIIEYLNNRDDISFDEMVAILKKLGFDVSADGTITW